MIEVKMANGDSFRGEITKDLKKEYACLPDGFWIIQNASGYQWLINKSFIVSIYNLDQ